MKATVLYRIASVLLMVYAAGNTYGLLNFRRASESMNNMHFRVGHGGFTFAQIMIGFLLLCSWYVLFGAYLAWRLSVLARTTPQAIGALRWVFIAYQLVVVFISWTFCTGLVVILSAVTAICIGWASWLSTGAPPARS